VEQHATIIPANDRHVMLLSIQNMMADLEVAKTASTDEPDIPPAVHTTITHTGGRGRPRIEIDSDILATAYQLAGPARLSEVFGVSARTIRRRALEQEIVQPGNPVYVTFTDDEGNTTRVYTSATGSQSTLTDEELDTIMLDILTTSPSFGRRMIDGHLHYLGQHVPRRRIQESYACVNGPPVAAFGLRRIQRRVYRVAGYNSLQHHDGQHGKFIFLLTMYHSLLVLSP
jgi:hypothetical protein